MRHSHEGCRQRSRLSCTSACWIWLVMVSRIMHKLPPSLTALDQLSATTMDTSNEAARSYIMSHTLMTPARHADLACATCAGDGNLEGDVADEVDPDNLSYEVSCCPHGPGHTLVGHTCSHYRCFLYNPLARRCSPAEH